MRPLDGITVLALEQAVAAPFATRQLADLGARVIKIERPNVGDFARGYDETVKGMSSHFVWLNRSKESLTLNLKHSRATPLLERLRERGCRNSESCAGRCATAWARRRIVVAEVSEAHCLRRFGLRG